MYVNSKDSAEKVCAELNGKSIGDSILSVSRHLTEVKKDNNYDDVELAVDWLKILESQLRTSLTIGGKSEVNDKI